MGDRDRERQKKDTPTGGEAQLRRDAVIGASATRVHPWWRGALTLAKGTRVASFDLPLTALHTFDIQMLTGKKTVHTRYLPLVYPAVGAPWEVYGILTSLSRWSPWQMLVADGQPVRELGYG
jgi:hypothetical protein